jgi:hypothetical protein
MSRLGRGTRTVATIVAAALLVGGGLASSVVAQPAPDRSEVVLVLDFSASILEDATNRNRFGAALERIADRVDETSADLVAGDATLSIVQFATKAVDYPGCADLRLLGSGPTVARFANCLRSVAGAYRRGLNPALTRKIGIDTNYVAAMEQAARHLPSDAVRPTLVLFTDGKHDVRGVPVSRVRAVRDRLFGSRSPFALLPVGMGLDPKKRDALASGLDRLQIIRDMPACISGTAFVWPRVVFQSPTDAATAVAVALQDATCTFTVAPTPTPTPAPTPGAVQAIRLTAADGRIVLAWAAPRSTPAPIVDYRARCRAGTGDWIESQEGVSTEPRATVEGLANGSAYRCEVAAIGTSSEGAWTTATITATPLGLPPAPGKPSVEGQDGALQVSVPPVDGADTSGYHYECSPDQGGTWPAQVDVNTANATVGQVGNLTNGMAYVCRAFAVNASGLSGASPVSEAVTPCGSLFQCNPVLGPIVGILGILALAGLLVALVALYRDRRSGYVVAVVDVVHIANLGRGSRLGIGFVRSPISKRVTGIVADRGPNADIRIRHLGGDRFEVIDRVGRHVTTPGEPILAADSVGARHELVLRAFATKAASPVSSAR